MKVLVDRDRCLGNGVCQAVNPDVFEVGEDGIVFTHDENIREEDRDRITRAVEGCPVQALRIVEDG